MTMDNSAGAVREPPCMVERIKLFTLVPRLLPGDEISRRFHRLDELRLLNKRYDGVLIRVARRNFSVRRSRKRVNDEAARRWMRYNGALFIQV